jgi:hypothetical protein
MIFVRMRGVKPASCAFWTDAVHTVARARGRERDSDRVNLRGFGAIGAIGRRTRSACRAKGREPRRALGSFHHSVDAAPAPRGYMPADMSINDQEPACMPPCYPTVETAARSASRPLIHHPWIASS